ncbi:9459_t:CDS:2, partial [Rhizophagus irregularis]
DQYSVFEINLKVGNSFKSWKDVQYIVDAYAKQHGFVANKYLNQPKKVEDISTHYNSTSVKTNCFWIINFYLGKRTDVINVIRFINEHHNYLCNSEIEMASKNSYLSQPVLDKIKHYTIDGHLGASQQYDFLTSFVKDEVNDSQPIST